MVIVYRKPSEFSHVCISCNVCGTSLSHVSCDAKLRFDRKGDLGLLRHHGVYTHACPPVSKLDADSEKAFTNQILSAPEAKPAQVVTGEGSRRICVCI